MKKITTTIAISVMLLATSHSAWSQLSIIPQIGYQFSLAGGEELPTSNVNGTQTAVNGSWGQGLAVGLALDYKFTPSFTLELAGRYWGGAQVSSSQISTTSTLTSSDITNANLHLFVLSLGDSYDFCSNSAFDPYLGFGLDLGVAGNIKSTETYTETGSALPSPYSSVGTATTTATLPLGAYAQLGAKYHLSSHFSVFAEIRIDALSLTPNKKTVNSYTVNGVNELNKLPLEETETDYEKSIPSSYTPSPTSPSQAIATPVPASTWGINIGIVYNIGSWSKATK